jgi:hypothetical protein
VKHLDAHMTSTGVFILVRCNQKLHTNYSRKGSPVRLQKWPFLLRVQGTVLIARYLDGWRPLLLVILPIPRPIPDIVHNLIANNCYNWFGKRYECHALSEDMRPASWADRFAAEVRV